MAFASCIHFVSVVQQRNKLQLQIVVAGMQQLLGNMLVKFLSSYLTVVTFCQLSFIDKFLICGLVTWVIRVPWNWHTL